jgi:hypothetical protein
MTSILLHLILGLVPITTRKQKQKSETGSLWERVAIISILPDLSFFLSFLFDNIAVSSGRVGLAAFVISG